MSRDLSWGVMVLSCQRACVLSYSTASRQSWTTKTWSLQQAWELGCAVGTDFILSEGTGIESEVNDLQEGRQGWQSRDCSCQNELAVREKPGKHCL